MRTRRERWEKQGNVLKNSGPLYEDATSKLNTLQANSKVNPKT